VFAARFKRLRGPHEMISRTGFGPRAVVWKPLPEIIDLQVVVS